MTGDTDHAGQPHDTAVPHRSRQSRAARELGLKRGEFDLAVISDASAPCRTKEAGGVASPAPRSSASVRGGGLSRDTGERVRAVGTTEGAALMDDRLGPVHPARPRSASSCR